MIKSFRNKALQSFFETGSARGLSVQKPERIGHILRALDDAVRPENMNLPGLRFHALKGNDKGRYSVLVTGNWRLTFGWDGVDATLVDLEDYH